MFDKKKKAEEIVAKTDTSRTNTANTDASDVADTAGTNAQAGQSDKKTPMVLAENLVKIYKTSDIEVLALQGLDLKVERGELTAIIGNSGSGKSTFLNMLGCLDEPSAGKL